MGVNIKFTDSGHLSKHDFNATYTQKKLQNLYTLSHCPMTPVLLNLVSFQTQNIYSECGSEFSLEKMFLKILWHCHFADDMISDRQAATWSPLRDGRYCSVTGKLVNSHSENLYLQILPVTSFGVHLNITGMALAI